MTGNFKITLLCDRRYEKRRWIVRNSNIFPSKYPTKTMPDRKRFCGLISLSDFFAELQTYDDYIRITKHYNGKLKQLAKFSKDYTGDTSKDGPLVGSEQNDSDVFRKFTIGEYIQLGNQFKLLKTRYNKKLDKFINVDENNL